MSTPNALTALIHDRLGQTLKDVFAKAASGNPTDIFRISPEQDSLVAQLEAPGDGPPRVTLGFLLDIVSSAVPTVPDGPGPAELLGKIRTALRGRLAFFKQMDLEDEIAALVAAADTVSIRNAGDALFARIDAVSLKPGRNDVFESVGQWVRLQPFIGGDMGTVMPFATMVNSVQGSGLPNVIEIPRSVERGLLDYFFKPAGYRTVDGVSVVAPVHLSDVGSALSKVDLGAGVEAAASAGVQQIKGLFSKPTAEHYIRDITRVIVESAYDTGRDLGGRFQGVTEKLRARKPKDAEKTAIATKFLSWFRGFAAMTESAAMRGVEIGTQGVSQFQTNPLIGAAAGSFAGTVARKLAQDSFLTVLSRELG
ncbi:MAG TPA: hypothetical protein VID28_11570 [Methylomirabilota bacterium]